MSETDAPADSRTEEPIACTLTEEERERRAEFVRSSFAPHVETVEEREDGFAFTVAEDGLDGLLRFVRREHECCSFADLEVHVTPGSNPNHLYFYGPDDLGEMAREGLVEPLLAEFDVELVA